MRKVQRKTRKHRGGACPPGMPPRVCVKFLEKQQRRVMNPEMKAAIRQYAKYMNWKRLSENERIKRQKAYWNSYVADRKSLTSGQSNDLQESNVEDINDYNESNLDHQGNE